MLKGTLTLNRKLLLCFVALIFSSAVASAAPGTPGFYRVSDSTHNLYVRMNAGGFVIGTVAGKNSPYFPNKTISDGFYLKDTGDGFWQWGYAYGTTNLCGWIEGNYLNPTRLSNSEPSCPNPKYTGGGGWDSRNHLLTYYASQVNDCGASGDACSGSNSTIVPVNGGGQWGLYGNYFSGGFHYQYANVAINSSTRVGWRYVTKDRQAVLIHDVTHGIWGFVPRGALPYCLPHTGGNSICG
ncbi:MAG TPA: hypothetical protein VFZ66_17130 [Herpetosiphonaceae bacterium]